MFTGLVETVGTVKQVREHQGGLLLSVEPDMAEFETRQGASVSVCGACLTVERVRGRTCEFSAVQETVRRTTLGALHAGSRVNLERALRLSDRLDGHVVLGHVDGVGRIVADRREGESVVRTIEVPEGLVRFMAEKGSVALDGVSLTIANSAGRTIDVALVPHTLRVTTMSLVRAGDRVNVECDVLARYLLHLVRSGEPGSAQADGGSLLAKMAQAGF